MKAIENAGSSIYWTDRDGTIAYVNPAFEALTGYTADEAIGRTPRLLKSGYHDEAFYADLWDTILNGDVWTGELVNERKDGHRYVVDQTIAPVRNDAGAIDGFVAVNQDITARKRNEQALQSAREKFETVFEHANDAIFIVDVEHDSIVDANSAAKDLVEYSRAELRSMPASDLHPHNLPKFMDFADRVFDRGQGWTDEITCYCKSGDIIPAEMSAAVIDLDGRPHLVNHIRERTDREERDWFEGLIDHSQDLITVVKHDGTVRYQSPSTSHVVGYDPDEIRGDAFVEYVHPDDRDDVRTVFDELTKNAGVVTKPVEYRFRRGDGSWAWLESVVSHPLDSPITGFVINSRDVTPRKESRQQAAVLNRMLRHNLRNDLNVVIRFAEELAAAESTQVATKAERILETVSDLTDATRHMNVLSDMLESHQRQQYRHDLTAQLERTAARIQADYPDATFDLDLPGETFVTSAPKLDVALEHLLRNAVEHNDADEPRVDVSVTHAGPETDGVSVVIADNGPGIPKHEQTVLLEGTETPLRHGSGLGLWIVNWIITRSGGRLGFGGNEPRGSRVTLTLPAAT